MTIRCVEVESQPHTPIADAQPPLIAPAKAAHVDRRIALDQPIQG